MKFIFVAVLCLGLALGSELSLLDLDGELAGAQAMLGLASLGSGDVDKINSLITTLQEKLDAEAAKLTAEDLAAKKLRDEAKAAWEALKEKLAVAKAELAALEKQLEDAKNKLAKYSSELSVAKKNYATVKAENDAERKTLAEEKTFIEDIQELIQDVRETKPGEERDTKLAQIGEKLDNLATTNLLAMSVGRDFEELGLIDKLLETMLKNIADRLEAMAAEEKELLAGIAALEKLVAEWEQKKADLEAKIVAAKVKVESLAKQVAAAEGKYLELAKLYETSHALYLKNMAVIEKEKALIKQILTRISTYKSSKKTEAPAPAKKDEMDELLS